ASFSYGILASGQESSSETKTKLEDVRGNEGKTDVDQLITNKRMRADSGSKSELSLSTQFSYYGGTVLQPGSKIRPNIRDAANTQTMAAIVGQVSGKYRVSERGSVSAGVGLQMLAPFHEPISNSAVTNAKGEKATRNDIFDPNVTYTYLDKFSGVQSVSTVSLIGNSTAYSRQYGYVATLEGSQTFMKDIGTTGLSLGALLVAGASSFDDFSFKARSNSSDYYFGIYPCLEYVFNDTFNFRTISGLWAYEHSRNARSPWTFAKNVIYQSVGLGISVTRDIFLYPNIQFQPEHIEAKATNVGLTAYVNVF
ncbi:MAG: hypothetical protein KDD35_11815, partial [Bdellovibrionales bacterium]|nr:hypothetical protein [Bdellovibrionales bacterium]